MVVIFGTFTKRNHDPLNLNIEKIQDSLRDWRMVHQWMPERFVRNHQPSAEDDYATLETDVPRLTTMPNKQLLVQTLDPWHPCFSVILVWLKVPIPSRRCQHWSPVQPIGSWLPGGVPKISKKVVEDHQPRVESILDQPLRASQVIDDGHFHLSGCKSPVYSGSSRNLLKIGWYYPIYLVILSYTLFFLWVNPCFFLDVFFQPVLIHDPASFSSPCALVSSTCASCVSDATAAKMSISSRCRVSNGLIRGDFQASK